MFTSISIREEERGGKRGRKAGEGKKRVFWGRGGDLKILKNKPLFR